MTWQRHWSIAGLAVVLTAVVLLIWNLWNRPGAETEDANAVRTRALAAIDGKLNDTRQWHTNFQNGPEFDMWLVGLRNELRPYFNLLSAEFDSRLIFILREFDAHTDNSGPLRDHSRQLALVSTRSLLEEERSRFEACSCPSADIKDQSVKPMRLPLSMLTEGW
jgi:hypothetical protein